MKINVSDRVFVSLEVDAPAGAGHANGESEIEPWHDRLNDNDLGQSVVIGLPSCLCYTFDRSAESLKVTRNRIQLIYQLEEFLPFDADDLAVGKIQSKTGQLIIASDSKGLIDLCQEFTDSGVHVRAITPTIFLALASLKRQYDLEEIDLVCWSNGQTADVVRLENGVPINWRWIASDDRPSVSEEAARVLEERDEVRVVLAGAHALNPDPHDERIHVINLELSRYDAASEEAQRICKGLALPPVDMRDGPLAPADPHYPYSRSLKIAAAALLFFQLTLIAAMAYRSSAYRRLSGELTAKSTREYQEVFPDERVPVGILARMQSEHRRLLGTRGLSSESVPRLQSIVPIAHVFLSAAPEPKDARYRFDRIELAPDEVALATGTAKSFSDQELIAERLRIAGLDVPPLSAQSGSGGVSLRLEDVSLKSPEEKDKE